MRAVLKVEKPGLFTTIQDLGRPGHRAFGVPPCGAMDRFALAAANRLVGNPDGAAGLECALSGPVLVALEGCLLAATGADFGMTVNGEEAPGWTGVYLSAGDRLSFSGRRSGARAYLALAGGLAGDRWLGSVATYMLTSRGGLGRALRTGDELAAASEPPRPTIAGRHLSSRLRPPYSREAVLRAIPGPHFARVARTSRAPLWKNPFEVSKDSDRMGYRLVGNEIELTGRDILSLGLTMGAVQLPNSGEPILLMADHQTAGGYPVVLGVARADLPVAAQLLPGDQLNFREVTVGAAQDAWRELHSALDTI